MTGAIVAFIIGALIGIAGLILALEFFAERSRRIDEDVARFNEEHPRRHLRVVDEQ